MHSPATEACDRGKKSDHYKSIRFLEKYLLIAQGRKHAGLFTPQKNGDWLNHTVKGDGGIITLTSIGAEIPIDDLYTNVEFPPPIRSHPNLS